MMEINIIILTIITALSVLGALYSYIRSNNYRNDIVRISTLNEMLNIENQKLAAQITSNIEEINREKDKRFIVEKDNEILKQKLIQLDQQREEWEKLKDKALEHAKAAIFEVGGTLSNKLIDEHKRESEENRVRSLNALKETTTAFHKQFENIVESVGFLNAQIQDSRKTVDIVKQALLSPSGAGNLSEITLENILKNSGLVSGTDYIMQYSFVNNSDQTIMRPDAVIFLPGDNLMVIDSKASKFFIELAENDDPLIRDKLILSMRNHVKNLASKNYRDGIKNYISKDKMQKNINHISMLMFLPSESALERVTSYDKEFLLKAWENHIYPCGPVGLINILSHSKFHITQNNQVNNYKVIIDEIYSLITSVTTLYEHARKVGSSLQSATANFDKFAGTFNSKIIRKAKKIIQLGIDSNSRQLNLEPIERYQIIVTDKLKLIEAENDQEDRQEISNIEESV